VIVRVDDLTGPEIGALLRHHLEEAHRNSPPGLAFAFDAERLREPDVTFWTAWDGDELLGCAALKEHAGAFGEVKSMRTAPAHLRKGVAAALLDHLIGEARARGYARVSLETGSGPAYEPALALYRRRGFVPGEGFGGYIASDFNQFFHLDL
jgi:putative acetyltransferase